MSFTLRRALTVTVTTGVLLLAATACSDDSSAEQALHRLRLVVLPGGRAVADLGVSTPVRIRQEHSDGYPRHHRR